MRETVYFLNAKQFKTWKRQIKAQNNKRLPDISHRKTTEKQHERTQPLGVNSFILTWHSIRLLPLKKYTFVSIEGDYLLHPMLFVLCCCDTVSFTDGEIASDDSLRELSVQMWINSECFANPLANSMERKNWLKRIKWLPSLVQLTKIWDMHNNCWNIWMENISPVISPHRCFHGFGII